MNIARVIVYCLKKTWPLTYLNLSIKWMSEIQMAFEIIWNPNFCVWLKCTNGVWNSDKSVWIWDNTKSVWNLYTFVWISETFCQTFSGKCTFLETELKSIVVSIPDTHLKFAFFIKKCLIKATIFKTPV